MRISIFDVRRNRKGEVERAVWPSTSYHNVHQPKQKQSNSIVDTILRMLKINIWFK